MSRRLGWFSLMCGMLHPRPRAVSLSVAEGRKIAVPRDLPHLLSDSAGRTSTGIRSRSDRLSRLGDYRACSRRQTWSLRDPRETRRGRHGRSVEGAGHSSQSPRRTEAAQGGVTTHVLSRKRVAIAALNHPHICQIFDIGPDYLVLEFIEGQPLEGGVDVDEAVQLAMQIAEALDAAHRKGVIHRDLKPANIMVTSDGSVKLLDFGLAKQTIDSDDGSTVEGTAVGTVMGTAAYMAPEQAEGKPLDVRSDIFSFGSVLYELLSGRRAFDGENFISVMTAILRDQPAPLDASPALNAIVKRCLAKEPGQRYQAVAELRDDLGKAQTGRPVARRYRRSPCCRSQAWARTRKTTTSATDSQRRSSIPSRRFRGSR